MWRRTLTACTCATCCGTLGLHDGNGTMVHNEEQNESRMAVDQLMQTSVSDVSLWKKSPENAHPRRSDAIFCIVLNQKADYLGMVLEHGWDVNEMLQVYSSQRRRVKSTALHLAVFRKWHNGVRLLLNAGADCNIKCDWSGEGHLIVPRHFARYPHRQFESNTMKHNPLCVATYNNDVQMVKLLLQNDADLKDSGCDYKAINLEQLEMQRWIDGCTEIARKENSDVLDELLTNGTKVRGDLDEQLQGLLLVYLFGSQFFPEHLDVLFTHGVHIDPDYGGGTLSHAFERESPINAIRWLIRHGASGTASLYPMLRLASLVYRRPEDEAYLVQSFQRYKLPLLEVLLQVGIKPWDSLKVHLGELELIIQGCLQQEHSGEQDDGIIHKTANIYHNILSEEHLNVTLDQRKAFSIDREKQMAHLREFSDHSLDVYPEELTELNMTDKKRERWEPTLKMVSNMLHFLNQPHTLQWHCRVCLRESLVSLSPSVIKTLSVPASLKRYILCHEL